MSPRGTRAKRDDSTPEGRSDEIDALIDKYATDLSDQAYLEFLEDMVDRAQTALDARKEELEDMGEEEEETDL